MAVGFFGFLASWIRRLAWPFWTAKFYLQSNEGSRKFMSNSYISNVQYVCAVDCTPANTDHMNVLYDVISGSVAVRCKQSRSNQQPVNHIILSCLTHCQNRDFSRDKRASPRVNLSQTHNRAHPVWHKKFTP